MRSALTELRKRADAGWRVLLLAAISALALAAVATVAGQDAMSRTLGTIAWTTALGGSVAGLLAGVGKKAPS